MMMFQNVMVCFKSDRLLESDELSSFWKTDVQLLRLKLNAVNPHGLTEVFFEEWLPRLVRGIQSCTFCESYRKRGEQERVTIEVTYAARYDKEELVGIIRSIVQEFKI